MPASSSPDVLHAPAPEASNDARLLRVLEGDHAGASRPVHSGEMLLIGSGEDCDIILTDAGVAARHAVLNVSDHSLRIRALDAALEIGFEPLPVGEQRELAGVQRVAMGSAVLAVGAASDPAWPDAPLPSSPAPVRRLGWLPAVGSIAVLSLASLALFAAVSPTLAPTPRPEEQARALIRPFGVLDARTTPGDGFATLAGTVRDNAGRQRLLQHIDAHALPVRLEIRTGDDVAADVREVLRTHGLTAQARYVGNGDVEITGHFPDPTVLRDAVTSRAMLDVAGVRRVLPRDLSGASATASDAAARPVPPVRIVAVVRGDAPHILVEDGRQFGVGDELPDGRRLIAIGTHAWLLGKEGVVEQVELPSPEAPPRGRAARRSAS